MLESGSAPALVAPQGQAPGDDRVARPGITMAGLPPSACSAHNARGARSSSDSPAKVPSGDCPLTQPAVPQATPQGLSAPLPTAQCQPRNLRPQRLPTSTPLPAALSSVPQFPLPEMGTDRQGEAFQRAAGDRAGSSGTPQPRRYIKPAALTSAEGSPVSRCPGPALPGCQGRGLGGTSGLEKRSRKERGAGRQLLGRGRRPGCRARDALARCTKPPLCEPRPSPPRWETAQGGFLGQAGSRGRVPCHPPPPQGGWGPPRLAGGLHLRATGQCQPA